MENKECISCDLEQKTGIDVSYCYQCGKCTAGCVLSEEMDYAPSYILRLLQTKNAQNDRRVLSSNAIWICLNCENCIARCPKEINIPEVMDYLREKSRQEGCISKEVTPCCSFPFRFSRISKRTGRLYEVGLVAGFKARTLRLTQDLNVAPVMFVKGKLNLLPERVKDENMIKRYLHKPLKRLKSNYENRFLSGMFAKWNFS
ncbi:4Fe-4S dicluster domain-containing protein [Bacteroides sp. CR5/BHMF/2]|nr:4Fe-4S dicluster domain-containing protein [Bacteroides sp. CR5/BHMF/2]